MNLIRKIPIQLKQILAGSDMYLNGLSLYDVEPHS